MTYIFDYQHPVNHGGCIRVKEKQKKMIGEGVDEALMEEEEEGREKRRKRQTD